MENVSVWQYVALIGTGFIFGFMAAVMLCRAEQREKDQLHKDELGLKVQQEIAKRIQEDGWHGLYR